MGFYFSCLRHNLDNKTSLTLPGMIGLDNQAFLSLPAEMLDCDKLKTKHVRSYLWSCLILTTKRFVYLTCEY